MVTTTRFYFGDASRMGEIESASVELVVTSPPYPMIEMWDRLFSDLHPAIAARFEAGDFDAAFRLMHEAVLRPAWQECRRVLKPGGVLCINVGDAVRTLGGTFRLFPNHVQVAQDCSSLGFTMLPGILWRKSTNKPNKFMGSGMLAPNAYVTLEHEHILIFRKGEKRRVTPDRQQQRYESAYFWEERNRWFSDVWTDLAGASQAVKSSHADLRERSAAFPLALPLRLVSMYSIYGDTVLDPFLGTGTTALAAAMLGRNAVGYETDDAFAPLIPERLEQAGPLSRQHNRRRIERHLAFLRRREEPCKHHNAFYDFDVVTRQEKHLKLYDIQRTEQTGDATFSFSYAPHLVQCVLAAAASAAV